MNYHYIFQAFPEHLYIELNYYEIWNNLMEMFYFDIHTKYVVYIWGYLILYKFSF